MVCLHPGWALQPKLNYCRYLDIFGVNSGASSRIVTVFNGGGREGGREECELAMVAMIFFLAGCCTCQEYSQLTAMFWDASIFSLSAREHLYSPDASLLIAFRV